MSQRRLWIIGLVATVALFAAACSPQVVRGSGHLITESRPVGNFDRVDLSGSGELLIIQSGVESLTVEADDNIMPFIASRVRGGTLYLDIEPRGLVRSISPSRIGYVLNVDSLESVEVSGSARVIAESLKTDEFDLAIGGSGSVKVDSLVADKLRAAIAGSAQMELGGEVNTQEVNISGSADYFARDLISENVDLTISGVGNATVWATETLSAFVSGLADVSYFGTPTTNFSVSGSADIISLGVK